MNALLCNNNTFKPGPLCVMYKFPHCFCVHAGFWFVPTVSQSSLSGHPHSVFVLKQHRETEDQGVWGIEKINLFFKGVREM